MKCRKLRIVKKPEICIEGGRFSAPVSSLFGRLAHLYILRRFIGLTKVDEAIVKL